MGTRREPRVPANLSVKIFGTDADGKPFSEAANTVDISRYGAKIEGLKASVRQGEVVGMSHAESKGRFTVQWVGEPNTPRAGQVGLLNSTPEKWKWSVALPPAYMDNYAGQSRVQRERRRYPRFKSSNSAQVQAENSSAPVWGKTVDISEGGCFVEMPIPLDRGSRIKLTIWIKERKLFAKGRVVSSRPGFGIGVQFTEMSPTDSQQLTEFLNGMAPVRT